MATDLFDAAGQRFNVDPNLLRAVFQTESGGRFTTPDSSAGAMGGMQLMPQTYATISQKYGLGNDPRDPVNNVMAGAAVLSENLDRFGNVPDALKAYNGGYDQSRWANPQTAAYVGKVAAAYQALPAPSAAPLPQASPDQTATDSYRVASADTGTGTDAMPDPSAPPRNQQASSTPPGSLSDDALHSMLTGSQSSSSPIGSGSSASPQNGGGQAISDDAIHAMLTGSPTPPQNTGAPDQPPAGVPSPSGATPPTGAAPASTPPPSAGLPQRGFMGGVTTAAEGVANLGDRISSYVDRNVPFMGAVDRAVLPALGMSSADQNQSELTADIAARDRANQGSFGYGAGKLAGDVAITAPVLSVGGALVGGAVRSVPLIENALSGVGNAIRALPGGNLLTGAAARATTGAAQGATAAAVTSGQSDQPIGQQVEQGALLGGGLGVAAPTLINAARSVANAVKGGAISQETAQLASLAQNTYGIPLTAGQISESPSVRFAASAASRVPFSGASGDQGATQTAFNNAVSKTIGEDATKITPAVMNAARVRLGSTFNSIAGNSFQADDQLVDDLADIEKNAQQVLPSSEWKPISNQLDNVLGSVDTAGNISGDAYQVLTRNGAPLDRAQSSSDPNVSYYAGQVRDALDDALARGIPADQQAALLQARSQWKSLKTIEPLVAKSPTGDINPAALMTPVKSSYGDIAYTGGGPLGDLARIGQLIKEPPSSGTAERGSALTTLRDIAGAGAGVVAGVTHPGDAAYVGGSLLGTAALARGVSSYLGSPIVTNSLIGRGLAGNPGPGLIQNALTGSAVPVGTLAGQNALAAPPPNALLGR